MNKRMNIRTFSGYSPAERICISFLQFEHCYLPSHGCGAMNIFIWWFSLLGQRLVCLRFHFHTRSSAGWRRGSFQSEVCPPVCTVDFAFTFCLRRMFGGIRMSWLFGGSAVFASFYFPPHQNVEKAHAPLKVHLAALVLHHHCLTCLC